MTTIRDVARLARVAPITVSRVLNNAGPVNVETRARVEAAIAELHYVPNVLARSLRFKRTQTLALVLTDITNPFWTRVARGVEDTARRFGYSVILCNTDENEAIQLDTVNLLLQKQANFIKKRLPGALFYKNNLCTLLISYPVKVIISVCLQITFVCKQL